MIPLLPHEYEFAKRLLRACCAAPDVAQLNPVLRDLLTDMVILGAVPENASDTVLMKDWGGYPWVGTAVYWLLRRAVHSRIFRESSTLVSSWGPKYYDELFAFLNTHAPE